jgi:citrate lyase beta subunit
MTQTTRPLTTVAPLRSLLFCPATSARRVRKMLELAPDAAVLDLEDAVTDENKTAARQQARAGIAEIAAIRSYVRVNHPSTGRTRDDIEAAVQFALDGIVLPKVEDADTVQAADGWITAAERQNGVEPGSTRLLVLIETAPWTDVEERRAQQAHRDARLAQAGRPAAALQADGGGRRRHRRHASVDVGAVGAKLRVARHSQSRSGHAARHRFWRGRAQQ